MFQEESVQPCFVLESLLWANKYQFLSFLHYCARVFNTFRTKTFWRRGVDSAAMNLPATKLGTAVLLLALLALVSPAASLTLNLKVLFLTTPGKRRASGCHLVAAGTVQIFGYIVTLIP